MKGINTKFLLAAGAVLSFVAGYWVHRAPDGTPASSTAAQRVLYYQDPMHPDYRSDKPGIAPDCGMQLEPVYGEPSNAATGTARAAGSILLTPAKEQFLGLKISAVSSGARTRSIRATGTVAVDESRIERVSALADGVVRKVSPLSAGSMVRKDDLLASYFVSSRDLFNAMQAFFLSNGTLDQNASTLNNSAILSTGGARARVEEELLRSYGVSSTQIREMLRTREVTRDIDFRAPLTGIVLERSVNAGAVVSKGSELFRIADLTHVWVIASIFESDAAAFQSGAAATVSYAGRTHKATVSNARQFDQNSRALKVRLEMENPGLELRPDMIVDVVLNVKQPAGLWVPADSVVDEGARKVVFVAGPGNSYQAREVTAGEEYNGQVRILSGLRPGEPVVAAGTFLLDAESRLRRTGEAANVASERTGGRSAVAAGMSDPVCGMALSGASRESLEYGGANYNFCSKRCKQKFKDRPATYVGGANAGNSVPQAGASS